MKRHEMKQLVGLTLLFLGLVVSLIATFALNGDDTVFIAGQVISFAGALIGLLIVVRGRK